MAAGAEPERPADPAGDKDGSGIALVEPGARHRADERLERARLVPGVRGEREDRLGVDGHLRLRAGAAERGEELVVVDDDPVVDPDHRPVAHGVVVGGDRRMTLGVVADVDEQLGRGWGTEIRSSRWLAGVRCFVTVGGVLPGRRYAYPTASAPRSAMPARSACAASVRSTSLRAERLYPAIPHIPGFLRKTPGRQRRSRPNVFYRRVEPLVVSRQLEPND